ncbi:C40 family peptidase [Dyadobacter sp. Leaf189]|uniref:C40 family peptidase n=1 Tax=Dyadobacter sp. Leaf189 TaxID=1736295 RepID=UPI0006FB0F4E|nr:C40 family peptidase [Dyadobacter sp. Leaf189]KQS31443.1 glycoside hydrolase [Dyadobacter sp. Leaf189]
MKKQITLSILFSFLFLNLLTSCDTLRKTPEKPGYAKTSGRRTLTSRKPAPKAPARKPAPRTAARPAAKPAYSTPGSLSAAEIPQVVQVARTYTGTPYRSGGNDKSGIDCSGLICSVYSEIGMKVPRISWQQSEFGQEVSQLKDLKAGDWLFFVPEAGKEGYVSHAGIVTDVRSPQEIIFIHASTSRGVREDNLFSNYFKGRFVKAMRPF